MSLFKMLMGSITYCKDLFARSGFSIFEEPVLSSAELSSIKSRCATSNSAIKLDAMGSLGEWAKYHIFDADGVMEVAPVLFERYDNIVDIASEVVGSKMVKSPHWRSSINIRMVQTGDTEGLHYDTNPIAALVFISGGAPLQIDINGEWVDVEPLPGHLAIFRGSVMAHRVPPVDYPQFRLTAPVNIYFEGKTDRPAWIDRLCYENMNYEDAASEEVS